MKRGTFAIIGVFAFIAMTPGIASAATAATRPGAIRESVTCKAGDSNYFYLQSNAFSGAKSWNATSSPYTLYFDTGKSPTYYCQEGSVGDLQFYQDGTSRCLDLDTASRYVAEGSCSASDAKWNLISLSGNAFELQNDSNKACLYDNKSNATTTYDPCNASSKYDSFTAFTTT
jgi:hypothetical protein